MRKRRYCITQEVLALYEGYRREKQRLKLKKCDLCLLAQS